MNTIEKMSVFNKSICNAIANMQKLGYTWVSGYNNWTAGDAIILKFIKKKTDKPVYLEASDHKGLYNGGNLIDVWNKLKITDIM